MCNLCYEIEGCFCDRRVARSRVREAVSLGGGTSPASLVRVCARAFIRLQLREDPHMTLEQCMIGSTASLGFEMDEIMKTAFSDEFFDMSIIKYAMMECSRIPRFMAIPCSCAHKYGSWGLFCRRKRMFEGYPRCFSLELREKRLRLE